MKFARKIPDWAKISSKNVSRWSRAGEEKQRQKGQKDELGNRTRSTFLCEVLHPFSAFRINLIRSQWGSAFP